MSNGKQLSTVDCFLYEVEIGIPKLLVVVLLRLFPLIIVSFLLFIILAFALNSICLLALSDLLHRMIE